jgi:hypothetical protein
MVEVEQPTKVQPSTKHRTLIDDRLATTAVFDMSPDEIVPEGADPEGVRLGEAVAEEIIRRLDILQHLEDEAAD